MICPDCRMSIEPLENPDEEFTHACICKNWRLTWFSQLRPSKKLLFAGDALFSVAKRKVTPGWSMLTLLGECFTSTLGTNTFPIRRKNEICSKVTCRYTFFARENKEMNCTNQHFIAKKGGVWLCLVASCHAQFVDAQEVWGCPECGREFLDGKEAHQMNCPWSVQCVILQGRNSLWKLFPMAPRLRSMSVSRSFVSWLIGVWKLESVQMWLHPSIPETISYWKLVRMELFLWVQRAVT